MSLGIRLSIFKMADAEAQFYFRFPIGWCPSHQKVNVYQQTKFRSYSSILVWITTISSFVKQTHVPASGYQILSKSGHLRWSNDVICNFKMAAGKEVDFYIAPLL